ncbi:MAG: hypothetical protein ABFD54_09405 [Armatimonadota bacterium]|nr:hypothetical protein [bacterium]
MSTLAFVLIVSIAIAWPLLRILMWAKVAKNSEAKTAELTQYPSLRKYVSYELAFLILFLAASTCMRYSKRGLLTWVGMLVVLLSVVSFFWIDKEKKKEINRLSNIDKQ